MPQSLCQMYTHLVFSTKHREPHLLDLDLAQRVHAYLAGTCGNLDSPALLVGGASDHVHILCRLSPKVTVMDFLRELKRESSKWVKQTSPFMRRFYWQSGYGAFSISPSHVEDLKRYIQNQVEHHRKETYQDEMRRFFKKYGMEYDERYVWD